MDLSNMLLRIGLVAEILAMIACSYFLYGRKFKLSVKVIALTLGLLTILEIINYYHLNGVFTLIGYLVMGIYCKCEFKSSIIKAIVNLLITIVIIAIIQFICMTFAELCMPGSNDVKAIITNVLLLLICTMLLSKARIDRMQKIFCKKNMFLIPLFCFICLVIGAMLLQKKLFYAIQIQHFILVIPAIVMMLFLIMKWYKMQIATESMEREIKLTEESQEKYSDLLVNVRLRQHEFKNHLAAIVSSHYTYKTYENLVQAQEAYCEKLVSENKYNNLLLLGDSVLAGYLFGKFQGAEADGITIEHTITTKMGKCDVPTYHMVEMLGILLDNAVEALKNSEDRIISFELKEAKDSYLFSIRNPYEYVPYDDIQEWFMLERSEKGSGRGLGLYHLKSLCEEWNCGIGCRNAEIAHRNWIEFTLEISKAEDN